MADRKNLWEKFILRSVVYGTFAGAVLGAVFPWFYFQIYTYPISGLLLGTPIGIFLGLVIGGGVGVANSFLLSTVTLIFFRLSENRTLYRISFDLVAILATFIICYLMLNFVLYDSIHSIVGEGLSKFASLVSAIGSISALLIGDRLALWYLKQGKITIQSQAR